jgi:hypothetical protein
MLMGRIRRVVNVAVGWPGVLDTSEIERDSHGGYWLSRGSHARMWDVRSVSRAGAGDAGIDAVVVPYGQYVDESS